MKIEEKRKTAGREREEERRSEREGTGGKTRIYRGRKEGRRREM